MHTSGRVLRDGDGYIYQWPGVYFETAFHGQAIAFAVGPGEVILHVCVDGQPVATLVRPAPGVYRVDGLADAPHTVRIDIATEHQAGPKRFDGFLLPPGSRALSLPRREARIEFVGDSHTVGYGNLSGTRDCSEAEVWERTDNTRAFGPLLARHYGADYRISAISGRGVVRNYAGGPGRTLPQAWPHALLDGHAVADDGWDPQAIVVALGTNDFSTPLHPGERWPDAERLRADFVARYAAFLRALRARDPDAYLLVWATALHEGRISAAAQAAVAELRDSGETRIGFVEVDGLDMGGCHFHPSLADHVRIASLLRAHLDAHAGPWTNAPHSGSSGPDR